MSKLGVHVSAGNRRGFGEFLQACAEADSPVPVIFSVDQDVWPDVEKFSPQTIVIFRHQNQDPHTGGQDGPGDAYVGEPIQSAQRWMAANIPAWRNNRAHYYAPLNEQDPGVLAGFTWLNAFTLECLRIADGQGFKLALYAFSGGNPKDVPTPAIGNPYTLEDAWRELIPSLQYAKQHGHILLLHEYGFGSEAANDGPATSLRASAPNLALRYRRSYRFLFQFNADPPLVISEAGAGVGGIQDISQTDWLADVKWYDNELMKDRIVLGCCLYQVGGDENLRAVLPALGNYISVTPTTTPESGDLPVIDDSNTVTPVEPPTPINPPHPVEPPIVVKPPHPVVEPPEPIELPVTPTEPLDFDVRLTGCRPDPDQPHDRIILTFEIDATGGTAPYAYECEGQSLAGPTRERPATRHGAIVESYTVTDANGHRQQRKVFFPANAFPC